MRILTVLLVSLAAAAQALKPADDAILKSISAELERSKSINIAGLEKPYFIEYSVEDDDLMSIGASMGALTASTHSPLRIQDVRIRVGDYGFDNTNYVFSDYYRGARYDSDQLPLENNILGLRHVLWLATDRAYKTSIEAIARKRSALKNVSLPDQLADYAKASPVQALLNVNRKPVDEGAWKARTVKLSGLFNAYPDVLMSNVEFQSALSTSYLLTSEGTVLRRPDDVAMVRARAYGQASDGMQLHDAEVVLAEDSSGLPSEAELQRIVSDLARNMSGLVRAPRGDSYVGPVLFEPRAAAQLFGQLLGDNLKLSRKPVPEPGRNAPHLPSELETRVGARILPTWMDVVDDPTQTDFHGQRLLGAYAYDLEGVAPKPLPLVEKGILRNFLTTRTPALKGFETSNGHARMPGSYGARGSGFGNLFVRASETVPFADLKNRLIDMCKQQNKPYGILVRKLDWPSSASFDELRRELSGMAQSGGGSRPVSMPLLVYRIYPDGREELIRGVRFRGLSTRSLKEIAAASDQPYVLNVLDSPATFALMGASNFVTSATVIAPGLLFEELELETIKDEMPKPPIVPPPAITE
ncbi:MAG TPA: metallopeptidase TldD-related protein [Bryobacteraceae bacterium]|nr:metallopeptidase TldD-related protein [Bryobacteraceae bacterium]